MDAAPAGTPRAKTTQVAPDAASVLTHRTSRAPKEKPSADARSPPVGGAGTADDLHQKVLFGGRAALKSNLLLYLKLLVPIAIVSVWMFSIFAVISWVVPSHLCTETAVELSVRAPAADGFRCCTPTSAALFPGSVLFYLQPAGIFCGAGQVRVQLGGRAVRAVQRVQGVLAPLLGGAVRLGVPLPGLRLQGHLRCGTLGGAVLHSRECFFLDCR